MPDWSYHPIFRPLLFRLPVALSRDLTLATMGAIARLPFGTRFIDLLGHMQPPGSLKCSILGMDLPGPLGLGAGFDPHLQALPALARFGFGFVEIGPIAINPVCPAKSIQRDVDQEALIYPEPPETTALGAVSKRIDIIRPLSIPMGVRLRVTPDSSVEEAGSQLCHMIATLKEDAAFFSVETPAAVIDGVWRCEEWKMAIDTAVAASSDRPILLCFPPDTEFRIVTDLIRLTGPAGISGVVLDGGIRSVAGTRTVGAPDRTASLNMVRLIHQHQPDCVIVAAGGIHEPADTIVLLHAGASLVEIHSGLVFSGPGLPKRTNEAIAFERSSAMKDSASSTLRRSEWEWWLLLGASMIFGGLLAWLIAVTRVVLPYDEAFVGTSREQLSAINSNLLLFMMHDRVTLAGTMISIGILYLGLTWNGIRQRVHWARRAYVASAGVGFASFFLFLGYGYFDPLHGIVAVILFAFFLLGWRWRATKPPEVPQPDLYNDWRWHYAYLGQMLFVMIGAGSILAGLTIAVTGVTQVFVPQDLAYLQTTAEQIAAINSRIMPLVAHDRAGFGGALVSDGIAVLLIALWGFRRGARWIWWTLLGAGFVGFISAISIHLAVGYQDFIHLAPAYLALALFTLGLILAQPYLFDKSKQKMLR